MVFKYLWFKLVFVGKVYVNVIKLQFLYYHYDIISDHMYIYFPWIHINSFLNIFILWIEPHVVCVWKLCSDKLQV